MKEAIQEAEKAYHENEIPVGAVVVCENKIIARGYNQVQKLNDCTAHAEMIALTAAFVYLGAKYLPRCTLYVTLEPCVMCAGALHWAQIETLVFAASDLKKGYDRFPEILHPKTQVIKGIMAQNAESLLINFFKDKR